MSQPTTQVIADRDREVESDKLFFDGLKHLTTLDTGLIVVLATLLEKVFSSPKQSWLIFFCLLSLGFSLFSCLWGMFSIGSKVQDGSMKSFVAPSVGLSFSGFLVALVALIVFVIINFQ